MILENVRRLGTRWQLLAASIAFLSVIAGTALTADSVSAAATYSCGTYSSGAYSSNSTCGASSSGSGTVGTPNTGFAKLMEPANLAAVLGSLALLIAGIVIMLRSRSRKKQDVAFTSRD